MAFSSSGKDKNTWIYLKSVALEAYSTKLKSMTMNKYNLNIG
jgi:hypothetical protein